MGNFVGFLVGKFVGWSVGNFVGFLVGNSVGCLVGSPVVGLVVGSSVGSGVPHRLPGGSFEFSQTVSLIQPWALDTRAYTPGMKAQP